ncbi:hypothetical protein AC578_10288 [Pseudocercospora eumusae]|uniref:DUF1445 domain-containing protein n=1 Tax=Pseudocercospora eumusae TaxID=321146 RepID=A0A139HRF1_9PEZI|nr:hypothetical protein AC578_10288 [Pseudocercospora eumusae]
MSQIRTGLALRRAARNNEINSSTAGLAPGWSQANLIVLPSRYANDFRLLCMRNPVPCPLLAESDKVGSYDRVKSRVPFLEDEDIMEHTCDLRKDAPKYMVYQDGELVKDHCPDVVEDWTEDHVAFLLGCSFTFERALTAAALPPRNITDKRNVPMYRTKTPLNPSGVFRDCTYVVSMRAYKETEIDNVREISRPYALMHGEPIDWGWDALERLGIADISKPEWGDSPLSSDGKPLGDVKGSSDDVPVFWGCGVTPQDAVLKAKLAGTIIAHAPGHMIGLDFRDSDVARIQ